MSDSHKPYGHKSGSWTRTFHDSLGFIEFSSNRLLLSARTFLYRMNTMNFESAIDNDN